MIKKYTLLFFIIFIGLNLNAQRNIVKFLGYDYNNNFAKPILLNNFNYDFNNINHSLAFGYERTIGNRYSMCANIFLPLSYSISNISVTSESNFYSISQQVSGLGMSLNTRIYLSELNNGTPNSKYFELGYTRYSYVNKMSINTSSNGASNPIYLGTLNHAVDINKIGVKYGIEKKAGKIMLDVFAMADINFWNASFDKVHFREFNITDYQRNFSISFGLLLGFNI